MVLATQGPSDLEAVDLALLPQVMQGTARQLVFRRGSPHDARLGEALFGQAWTEGVTRYSDGRTSWRQVERPRVSVDESAAALRFQSAPITPGQQVYQFSICSPARRRA